MMISAGGGWPQDCLTKSFKSAQQPSGKGWPENKQEDVKPRQKPKKVIRSK